MAHFAQIENGVVVQVVVVDNAILLDENEVEQEALGIAHLQRILGGRWAQTSYSGSIRRKYAGIGDIYNEGLQMYFSPHELEGQEIVEWQE